MLSNFNPDSLRPVQPDEPLPPISRWTTLGGLGFLALFSTAIALAGLLKYKVTIKAPATVRPAGELRIVQAATEGTIKSIEVKENQAVKQGEAITYIDDSRLQTKKSQLLGNIQQAQLQLAQLAAQIRALDRQIAAETDQMNRIIASAQAELSRNQRNYQDKLITTEAEVEEVEAALKLAEEELATYQQLGNTGAVAQLQIKVKEAALKTAIARLKRAKTVLNPTDAEVTMAQERIAQEKATGEAVLAALKKEREQLIQQQIETQNQLSRDSQELKQVETELSGNVIRASVSGTIQQLNLRNTEQVVRPGEVIAQISPIDAPLEIKALVASQDIDKVEKGQRVQMRVSACPYPDYGTLKGTVKTISPDAMTPQGNGADASEGSSADAAGASYKVLIQPESLSLSVGGRECSIQSGMEGRADIISREETVLTFILRKARLLIDF